MFETVAADVRLAVRWLVKSPGFTAVAVGSLAIGIGFNTALFAVVDAVLFRPLPVSRPDQLVDVYTSENGADGAKRFATSSYPDYLDLKASNTVFEDLAGYSPMFAALNLGDRSRLALGEVVTGNYFRTLGVGAAIGRTLVPADDAPSAPRVAMISFPYWSRELGASPAVIGRTLKLRGNDYTIVGVAPRGFGGMTAILSPDLWVPITAATEVEPIGMHDTLPSPGTSRLERRGERWLFMKGRLKPGVTTAQARANLDLVMAGLERANPVSNKDKRIAVARTADVRFHPAADPVLMPIAAGLMLTVGLVLLIACANVASMLLARASGRQKEIGIRLAIGATRHRLVQQLITESLVLSALGALAGVLLAWWTTLLLRSINLPVPIPLAFDLRIDGRAFLFTTAAAVASGLVAGVIPAIRASRPNLVAELRADMSAPAASGHRWTLRDVLVAGQMAITAVLLVVAALLTRSLVAAQRAAVGFATDRLALVSIDTTMVRYSDERSRQFFDESLARLRQLAGVEAVTLTTRPPFSVNYNRWNIWVPGHHRAGDQADVVEVTSIAPEYFTTLGVPIVEGRAIDERDQPNTFRAAVVNQTFARRYWPKTSAVGRTVNSRGPEGTPFTIVGVVADYKVTTVGEAPTPFFHVAREQQPNPYGVVMARTHGDAGTLLRDMRRELLSLEPNLVFVENQTMDAEVAATLFPVRAGAWLVGIVGVMAMMLAAVGLYGVIAYSVARRTREIGIRMALGAEPSAVLALVMRQGLIVAMAGLLGGSIAAAAASRAVAGVLYGIRASDPVSWAGAALLLLTASALANLIPARRAARVAPSEALRVE